MIRQVVIDKQGKYAPVAQQRMPQITEMRATRNQMPADPNFGIFDNQTGPTIGSVNAAQQASNFPRTLGFIIHNTNTTGNPAKFVLFDAAGAYAEANSYTAPAGLTLEATNFLYGLLKEELKQGRKLLVNQIDIQILLPTGNDVSQFSNGINVVTHGVAVRNSTYLTSILPTNFVNENAYQVGIKNMKVDLALDNLLALEMKINLATKISIIFHIAGTN